MKQFSIFLYLALGVIFTSCIKTAVDPVEDNELITRVELKFQEIESESEFDTENEEEDEEEEIKYIWSDKNGDGVVDSIDPVALKQNQEYKLSIEFWDDTKSPAENITEEVEEAGDIHLVKVKITPNGFVSSKTKDKDSKGRELGLKHYFRPNAKGKGIINVLLLHQPLVDGKEIKDGFSENGSTDIDVKFDLAVQ